MEKLHRNTFLRSALVKDPFCFGDIGPEDVLRIESQFPDLFHSRPQIEAERVKEIFISSPPKLPLPKPKVPVSPDGKCKKPKTPPPSRELMSPSRKNYEMPIKCTKPRCQPDWKPLTTPIKKKVKSSILNETPVTPKTEISLPFNEFMQMSQEIVPYEELVMPVIPKKRDFLEKEKKKLLNGNFSFLSSARKKLSGKAKLPVQNKRGEGIQNESEKAKIIKKLQEKLVIDPFIRRKWSTYGPPPNLHQTVIEVLQKQEKSSLEKLALEIFRGNKFSMPRELIQPRKTLSIQPVLQNRAIRSPTSPKNVKVRNDKLNFKNKEPPTTPIDHKLKVVEWRKSTSSFATTEESNGTLEEIVLPYKIERIEPKKEKPEQRIDKRSSKCSQTDQMSIQPRNDLKEMIREVLGGEMMSLEKIAEKLIQAEIQKQKTKVADSQLEIGIQKDESSKENSASIHFEKTEAEKSSEEIDYDLLPTPTLTPKEQLKNKEHKEHKGNSSLIEAERKPSTPQITPEKLQKDKDEVTDCSEISEFIFSQSNPNGLKGVKDKKPMLDETEEGIQEIKTPIFTSLLSEKEKSVSSLGKTEISGISLTLNDMGGISIGTEKTNPEKSKSKVSFAKTLSQKEKSGEKIKYSKSSQEDSYTLDFENPVSQSQKSVSEYVLSLGEYLSDASKSPGELSSKYSTGQLVEIRRLYPYDSNEYEDDFEDLTDNYELSLGEIL